MVALPQVYNVADLPDTGGNTVLIPAGQYQAVIVDSGYKETSKKDGQYLWLKVIITQGQYAHTEFTERLNVINPNNTAMEIAYKTLARISEAVGLITTPQDSVQLHNKPLMIEVATEAAEKWTDKNGQVRDGKDKSFIKKWHALPATGGATATPFGTPAFAAPVAVQAQPVAVATVAPVATNVAPWGSR